jgi:hypothetical protein
VHFLEMAVHFLPCYFHACTLRAVREYFVLKEVCSLHLVYNSFIFQLLTQLHMSQHTRFNRTLVIISVSWLYYNITHHTIGCICQVTCCTSLQKNNRVINNQFRRIPFSMPKAAAATQHVEETERGFETNNQH